MQAERGPARRRRPGLRQGGSILQPLSNELLRFVFPCLCLRLSNNVVVHLTLAVSRAVTAKRMRGVSAALDTGWAPSNSHIY